MLEVKVRIDCTPYQVVVKDSEQNEHRPEVIDENGDPIECGSGTEQEGVYVDVGNYNNCVIPLYDRKLKDFVESATEEQIAAARPMVVRDDKITLDGLDITQVVDLLRWQGL